MRRRLSILALALALAAAAAPSTLALPAEGDDTTTGGSGGSSGDSDTGSTDPIKLASELIDQATDNLIVANTNLATGAVADTAHAVEDTADLHLQNAAASLLQGGTLPKLELGTPTTLSAAAATAAEADPTKMLKELITSTDAAPEELLKKVEGFAIKLDANGCYKIMGPNELSLKLCEDDAGARKPIVSKVTGAAHSWVNGTITNTGATPLCKFAFASPTTDLVNEAVKIVPSNLPVALPNVAPRTTIDLAPGEELPFAFLLPFDIKTGTPGFVGFADTLAACPVVVKKLGFPEKISDATTDAAAAAVAQGAQGAGVAMEQVAKVAGAAAEGAVVKTLDHEGVEVQQTMSPAAATRSVSLAAGLAAVGASVLAFVLA